MGHLGSGSRAGRLLRHFGPVAGADSLGSGERAGLLAALGRDDDLAGLTILHVQCHIGFDTVSLARRGAHVTGTDFSAASLAKAAYIAARSGVSIDWVEAESTALPRSLHGRFDLVYATVGVLCWIGDVPAWMSSVAATLAPGSQSGASRSTWMRTGIHAA